MQTRVILTPVVRYARLSVGVLAWAGLAVALFIACTAMPSFTAGPDADAGWAQLLSYLSVRNARFGVDFIFPYGPLHELVLGAYEPSRFYHKYVLEILSKLAVTVILIRFSKTLNPIVGGLWITAITLLMLAFPTMHPELYLVTGAAVLVMMLRETTLVNIVAGTVFLAAVSLTKFTLCPFAIAGVVIVTVSRRRVSPILCYSAALAGFWVLSGQHVSDLPAFLKSGFEYSSAYAEGMALEGPTLEVRLALGILALMLWTAWSRERLAETAVLAVLAAVAWKAGFVRHDQHALSFFAITALMSVFFVRPTHAVGGLGIAILSLFGAGLVIDRSEIPVTFEWTARLRNLAAPGELQARLERERLDLKARYALPRIKQEVQNATIDVFTDCHGVALLNELNIQPRPTLQSVNAVATPWLQRNAEFLRSENGPRYVMLNWVSFDLRYPTLTDGPALLAIHDGYEYLFEENGYQLWRRKPQSVTRDIVREQTAAIDEVVEIPPGCTAQFRIDFTSLGTLRMLAYRPPVLFFLARDEHGEWHPFRLVRPMAACEFMLDTPEFRPTAIKLHVMKVERKYVAPTYTVTLRR